MPSNHAQSQAKEASPDGFYSIELCNIRVKLRLNWSRVLAQSYYENICVELLLRTRNTVSACSASALCYKSSSIRYRIQEQQQPKYARKSMFERDRSFYISLQTLWTREYYANDDGDNHHHDTTYTEELFTRRLFTRYWDWASLGVSNRHYSCCCCWLWWVAKLALAERRKMTTTKYTHLFA